MAEKSSDDHSGPKNSRWKKKPGFRKGIGQKLHAVAKAVEQSSQGIAVADLAGNLQYLNRAFALCHGYSVDELIGKHLSVLHNADQMTSVEAAILKIKQVGFFMGEIGHTRRDGKVFRAVMLNSLIRNEAGRPIGMLGTMGDMSQEKQHDEALKESEERYRIFFKQAADSVAIVDPQTGMFLDFNETAHRNLGYSREEFQNLHLSDIQAVESKQEVTDHIKRIVEKKSDAFETKHRTKLGDIRNSLVSSRVISIQGKAYLQSIWRDISERKQTEKALLDSENNFRALAENVNDGILIAIEDGRHIFANRCAAEITGYTTSELLEMRIGDLAHPNEYDRIIERYRKIISGRPFERQYETILVHKDGRSVPIEASSAQTVWQGNPADIVSIRDITQRKKVEKSLQEIHERLEHQVDLRTSELKIKTKRLEETNTALNVLMKKWQEKTTEIEDNVLNNVKELVEPLLENLKKSGLNNKQMAVAQALESNLRDCVSAFAQKMSSTLYSLTATEIQVANFIKHGKRTKEIALLLNLSPKTIKNHRAGIRKKLGIVHKGINLRTHLLSLD